MKIKLNRLDSLSGGHIIEVATKRTNNTGCVQFDHQ